MLVWALLVGLLGLAVAGAAEAIALRRQQSTAGLPCRVSPGEKDAQTASSPEGAGGRLSSRGNTHETALGEPVAHLPWRHLLDILTVATGVVVVTFAGWKAFCRRRRRPASTSADETSRAELSRSALQMRVYAKRQRLWWALLKDSDLMLKNRIEVRHLMTRDLLVVSPTASTEQMRGLMEQNRVRHLLVCNDSGRLIGIVSNRDLFSRSGDTAEQVMTPSPRTVSSNTPIGVAITRLVDANISCLPVVNHGRLCGVITSTDLVLTLQCTLQLWLRVAQTMQSTPNWMEGLETTGRRIDSDLAKQQQRLAKLKEQFSRLAASGEQEVWNTLSKQIAEVLESSTELADQITNARDQVREHTQWLVNLIDLRTDSLTGLSNRRELPGMLDMMLALRRRHKQPFCLVMLAIDNFQMLGDQNPDPLTAQMLKAVAELIADSVRASDFIARYEDNTFAVILPHTDLEGACIFSERVRRAAEDRFRSESSLTLSSGVVLALGDENSSALLARAQGALAQAQSAGGNRVACHNGDDFELVDRETLMVA